MKVTKSSWAWCARGDNSVSEIPTQKATLFLACSVEQGPADAVRVHLLCIEERFPPLRGTSGIQDSFSPSFQKFRDFLDIFRLDSHFFHG